jgi:putative heme-binding domain-containing protein
VQLAARTVARYLELPGYVATARREALDRSLGVRRRELAVYGLGGAPFAEARPVLEAIIAGESDPAIVKPALSALGSFDDPAAGEVVLGHWKDLGPATRGAALDLLLDHRSRIPQLLGALESGRIEPAALDLPRREKLLRSPDAPVAERARKIFGDRPGDRSKVVEEFRAALAEPGDAVRGKGVFEKTCAQCHLPRRGRRIGPDLSGVSSRTRGQLLEDILDPSRSIDPRFTNYIVVVRDGRILDGLIAGETPGTLMVRRSEGDDEVLLRSNVAQIRASSTSLMPDGLEAGMSRSDLADLIAFLQGANLRSAK